jgi:hypothetical protein
VLLPRLRRPFTVSPFSLSLRAPLTHHLSDLSLRSIVASVGSPHPRRVPLSTVVMRERGCHLARDGELLAVLVARRRPLRVTVVERDGHRGLGHAGLPLLVHQILQVARPHLCAHPTHNARSSATAPNNVRGCGVVWHRAGALWPLSGPAAVSCAPHAAAPCTASQPAPPHRKQRASDVLLLGGLYSPHPALRMPVRGNGVSSTILLSTVNAPAWASPRLGANVVCETGLGPRVTGWQLRACGSGSGRHPPNVQQVNGCWGVPSSAQRPRAPLPYERVRPCARAAD